MIYLDNAATTYHKPQQVIDAVVSAMQGMGNSSRGSHSGALKAARTVYDARCKAAALFGCDDPSRVVFTANSTEALNIAISGLFAAGDHIISTDLEHNSVLRPLYRLQAEQGVSLDFVRADRKGCVDYEDFERLIRHYDRPVSLFYCDPPYHNTEGFYRNVGEKGFTEEDHIRLRDALLNIQGKFLLSYNDDEFIHRLYDWPDIHIVETTRIHSMRQRIEPSSQFPELIISNFDPYERKRHLPVQMSLFNYSQEEEPYEI